MNIAGVRGLSDRPIRGRTTLAASNFKSLRVTRRGFRVRAGDPCKIPASVRGPTRKVPCRVRRLAGPRRCPAQSAHCFVGCYGGLCCQPLMRKTGLLHSIQQRSAVPIPSAAIVQCTFTLVSKGFLHTSHKFSTVDFTIKYSQELIKYHTCVLCHYLTRTNSCCFYSMTFGISQQRTISFENFA